MQAEEARKGMKWLEEMHVLFSESLAAKGNQTPTHPEDHLSTGSHHGQKKPWWR